LRRIKRGYAPHTRHTCRNARRLHTAVTTQRWPVCTSTVRWRWFSCRCLLSASTLNRNTSGRNDLRTVTDSLRTKHRRRQRSPQVWLYITFEIFHRAVVRCDQFNPDSYSFRSMSWPSRLIIVRRSDISLLELHTAIDFVALQKLIQLKLQCSPYASVSFY